MARTDNLEDFLQDVAAVIKHRRNYEQTDKIPASEFDLEIGDITDIPKGIYIQEEGPELAIGPELWLKQSDAEEAPFTESIPDEVLDYPFRGVSETHTLREFLPKANPEHIAAINSMKKHLIQATYYGRQIEIIITDVNKVYKQWSGSEYTAYVSDGYVVTLSNSGSTISRGSNGGRFWSTCRYLDFDAYDSETSTVIWKAQNLFPIKKEEDGLHIIVDGVKTTVYEIKNYTADKILDTTPGNIIASDILEGKIGYAKNAKIVGTMPNNGELNYIPTTEEQIIPTGYTAGGSIAGVTSDIDANILAENIKKDVTILGVTGTLEGTSEDLQEQLDNQDRIIAELQEAVKSKGSGSGITLNVFAQETEPTSKDGIWVKTSDTIAKVTSSDAEIEGDGNWGDSFSIEGVDFSRSGVASAVVGDYVYFFSSKSYSSFVGQDCKVNLKTLEKTNISNTGTDYYKKNSAVIGTDIYFMADTTYESRANLMKYDTIADTYTFIEFGGDLANGSGGVIIVKGNDLYITGVQSYSSSTGYDATGIYKYDLTSKLSTKIATWPSDMVSSGVGRNYILVGDEIYSFGAAPTSKFTSWAAGNVACKFNIVTKEFTKLSDMPTNTNDNSKIGYYNGKIYILGGNEYTSSIQEDNSHHFVIYDIATDTYKSLPETIPQFANTIDKKLHLYDNMFYAFSNKLYDSVAYTYELPGIELENNELVLLQRTMGYMTKLCKDIKVGFSNVVYQDSTGSQSSKIYIGTGETWQSIN